MFGIGAFARIGQVSLRTLRYYDEEDLLRPAAVDDHTGYRWYGAGQLHRLNRILALRDLGLSLAEVAQVLADELSPAELRGMLRLRQAEARQRLEAEAARLARVEARLTRIEAEDRLGDYDVIVKRLEPLHVAFVAETAAAFGDEALGPILARLYPQLQSDLERAGLRSAGPPIALYGDSGEDDAPIKVLAAMPLDAGAGPGGGVEILEVASVARAATTVHKGPMSQVTEGYQALARWAEETAERIDGYSRELYLACDGDQETWVTELQFPLGETPTTSKEA